MADTGPAARAFLTTFSQPEILFCSAKRSIISLLIPCADAMAETLISDRVSKSFFIVLDMFVLLFFSSFVMSEACVCMLAFCANSECAAAYYNVSHALWPVQLANLIKK